VRLLVHSEGSQVPHAPILLPPALAAGAESRSGSKLGADSRCLSCPGSLRRSGSGSAGTFATAELGLQKVLLLQGCVSEEPSLTLQSQAEPRSGPAEKTNTELHPTLFYSRTAI